MQQGAPDNAAGQALAALAAAAAREEARANSEVSAASANVPGGAREVVGVRQQGGQYKVNPNSDFSPWVGPDGAVAEPGKFKSVVLYGMLLLGEKGQRVRHFFGHGDTIIFRRGESEARGVCLGFAEPEGKAYGIIVRPQGEEEAVLVNRRQYVRLAKMSSQHTVANARSGWLAFFRRVQPREVTRLAVYWNSHCPR